MRRVGRRSSIPIGRTRVDRPVARMRVGERSEVTVVSIAAVAVIASVVILLAVVVRRRRRA